MSTAGDDLYRHASVLSLTAGRYRAETHACIRTNSPSGPRPRFLLLHGNPGSLSDWHRVLPLLAEVGDVSAIDLPGFGRSPNWNDVPPPPGLDVLADLAIAAIDAIGWRDPVVLVGHSHGGGISQAAAVRHPTRVAGIVLIGTLGAPPQRSYRMLALPGAETVVRAAGWLFRSGGAGSVSRAILRAFMRDIVAPEPVTEAMVERELSFFARRPEVLVNMVRLALGRPSDQLRDRAARIQCPALFLHGQDDALVPFHCARSIHERILGGGGRSELIVLPRAGHMLVAYQAAPVAEHIVRFSSSLV